jgi:hypothetical protein
MTYATVAEKALELRVSEATVRRHAPVIRIGRRVL